MREKYLCPECHKEVELIAACGAAQYFCNHCKKLVSSKAVIKVESENEDRNE